MLYGCLVEKRVFEYHKFIMFNSKCYVGNFSNLFYSYAGSRLHFVQVKVNMPTLSFDTPCFFLLWKVKSIQKHY